MANPSKVLYRTYILTLGICGLLLGCGPAKSGSEGTQVTGSPPEPGTCVGGPTSVSLGLFYENPRTSSGNSTLPFSATLSSSMTVAGTLTGLSGNCLLQNDRYSITYDSLYPQSVAKITSESAVFSPLAPEFRQLNSFYYATALRNLLVDSLGASLPGVISIDSHCNQQDNAYFSPLAKRLCFGWHAAGAGKIVWAADDADVVIHEAGHSVNHSLASTSILNSSFEAGAIDESLSDYWALTILNDAELSEWFLGAMGSSYIRDAKENHAYPSGLVAEIHDDSRILTELLWDLRSTSSLGKADTDRLVKKALQLLPATARFSDFYQAFYDASGPSFLNLSAAKRSLIISKFAAKGLHRVDSAAGLRLSSAGKQVYVIDDHSYGFQSNGNCNGVLDVGETALVLVNLENSSVASLGVGVAALGATPAGVSVIPGGGGADYFRLNSGSDFVSSLPPDAAGREDAVLWASFVLRATAPGQKSFSLVFKPMYSDPTGVSSPEADANVAFSLNVGTASNSGSCNSAALWP